MTTPPPLDVTTWSVAADGTRTPFKYSGLRIPVGGSTWVEVDFDIVRRPIRVRVGVRARRDADRALPSLMIRPRAGNSLVMLIGSGTQLAGDQLRVIPINEFKVDLKDFFKVLSQYTSGDFAGEEALARPHPEQTAARQFVIQYSNLGSINVGVARSEDALLCVDIKIEHERFADRGQSFRGLSLGLNLHACNLVSCHFEEVTFTCPELPKDAG